MVIFTVTKLIVLYYCSSQSSIEFIFDPHYYICALTLYGYPSPPLWRQPSVTQQGSALPFIRSNFIVASGFEPQCQFLYGRPVYRLIILWNTPCMSIHMSLPIQMMSPIMHCLSFILRGFGLRSSKCGSIGAASSLKCWPPPSHRYSAGFLHLSSICWTDRTLSALLILCSIA